jgi:hypothetical protein
MRSRQHARPIRRAVAAALAAAVLLPCPTLAAGPCPGGVDVRKVADGEAPAAVRQKILDPGPIAGRYLGGDPARPNPDYPSGRIVVLRVAAPDLPRNPRLGSNYVSAVFFNAASTAASVRNYFAENSWGAFQVRSGGVPDWVRLRERLASYGALDDERFLAAALARADVDWPALDADRDGVIRRGETALVLLLPDGGATGGRDRVLRLPEFAAATPRGSFRFRLPVVRFGVAAARDVALAANPIRSLPALCRELARALFDLPARDAAATGPYDPLAGGDARLDLNLHDRMKIGWLQPRVLSGHLGRCLAFPASEATAAGLVLVYAGHGDARPEYWLVENRYKPGSAGRFDADLPASGLVVWWVGVGTGPGGHDDVRPVDAAKPGAVPVSAGPPGPAAAFARDPATPRQALRSATGEPTPLWFAGVSKPGATMFAEF